MWPINIQYAKKHHMEWYEKAWLEEVKSKTKLELYGNIKRKYKTESYIK